MEDTIDVPTARSDVATTTQQIPQEPNDAAERNKFVTIVYGLFALGLLFGGLPTLVGVIMAHIKRGEYRGSIYGDHLGLLIRTFWCALALSIIAGISTIWTIYNAFTASSFSFFGLGTIILIATSIWYIYRIIRGFIRLNDKKTTW